MEPEIPETPGQQPYFPRRPAASRQRRRGKQTARKKFAGGAAAMGRAQVGVAHEACFSGAAIQCP